MKRVLAGLTILSKYTPDGSMAAEHDEIYADGPEPKDLQAGDAELLEENGWSYKEEFSSWHKFV